MTADRGFTLLWKSGNDLRQSVCLASLPWEAFPAGARPSTVAPGIYHTCCHPTLPVTLLDKQQRLVDEFAVFDDPHERLTAVVDRAKKHRPLDPSRRIDGHRVPGCVSVVWLVPELREGRCHFHADAESPMVRGLVVMLADFFSGATPAEIASSEADPLEALDLTRNLSPTRRNGLAATRAAIRVFATNVLAAPK
jgi:cysteine desulfuration protein SufE